MEVIVIEAKTFQVVDIETQWELKAISPTINFRKSGGMAKKRKSFFFKKKTIY